MLEQGRCDYHAWESVFDALMQLPSLQQVTFSIEAHGREVEALFSSAPMGWRCIIDDEVNDAMQEWLMTQKQTTFVIGHRGCKSPQEDIGALSRILAFVYHVLVARYCNAHDQGPLRHPRFRQRVTSHLQPT